MTSAISVIPLAFFLVKYRLVLNFSFEFIQIPPQRYFLLLCTLQLNHIQSSVKNIQLKVKNIIHKYNNIWCQKVQYFHMEFHKKKHISVHSSFYIIGNSKNLI